MNWLIVTGDDFGMSRGINRGIVQAHRDGILTTASLLVNWPASEEAAALGRACPTLSLELHLELDIDIDVPAQLEHQLARFRELAAAAPGPCATTGSTRRSSTRASASWASATSLGRSLFLNIFLNS